MKKLILIDGNALVHRAFHALPPLTSPSGVVTNAVFGFSSILIKTIKELKPDYIAAAFDLKGPTFRHEQFAEYKIHREKAPQELYNQIPLVKEVLEAFGVPIYTKEGYEADDLIGTLATRAKSKKDLKTIIATGDLDALQLVEGKKVSVFTLRKGVSDTVIYDEDAVLARYGLKPEQLNDYRGLKGDPSDNIPGVPGVGEKTASELIKRFGGLEALYQFLENPKPSAPPKQPLQLRRPGKLQMSNESRTAALQPEYRDNIFAETESRSSTGLRPGSPVVRDKISKSKTQKIETEKSEISEKLAEKLLANKKQAFFSRQLSTVITDLDVDFTFEKSAWRENVDISKIETVFRDLGFSSLLKRLPEIGLTKQAGMDFNEAPIRSTDEGHLEFDLDKNNIYITDPADKKVRKTILLKPNAIVIGHDLKKLFAAARQDGESIKNKIFDTMIAAYLLNPDLKDYDFDKIYYAEFNELPSESQINRPAHLWRLKKRLEVKLKSVKLTEVFENIEMPLIPVLAEMEYRGIKIDTESLAGLLKSTSKELAKLEEKIYKLAGADFNINSPQQLSEILFVKLGIKGRVRKTGGGALSTAAPELEKLREEHPIIDLILQYRELQKLKTTYIEPFPQLVSPTDRRLHTTYNQTGTGTGRLSSENPNLQNVPIKTELGQEFRKAFMAEDGYQLVSFDYSQIELRIVAHLAHDKKMIEVFKRGEDIHTATASEIFEVKPQDVTKEMRRQAKALNFGIIYGMGPLGFARSADVTTQRAREFITKYFADFSGVAKYMEETKGKAHRDGYVETLFGRRRPLLDIYSTIPQVQAQAERMAINHPVQGTAADLMKLAMIKIYQYLHLPQFQGSTLDNDVRLLLQVHDELVFEIKTELVKKLAPHHFGTIQSGGGLAQEFKKIMESVHTLDVPLVVDVRYGKNWQETEEL